MPKKVDEQAIQLAIAAFREGREPTLKAAAAAHNVAASTVTARYRGRKTSIENYETQQRLTPTQEACLAQYVNTLVEWQFPVRCRDLPRIAERLLPPFDNEPLGVHWTSRFLHRWDLVSVLSRPLDCQRAWNNDPVVINEWFAFFRRILDKYKITPHRLYNMDEKGVILGMATRSKVITPRASLRKAVQQPGNREFVSVIECVSADGRALAPFIIWKAKQHQASWYNEAEFSSWRFAISERGWTDRDLALSWIQMFDSQTQGDIIDNEWRMLLLDNHDSHLTWQFIFYALERKIILITLPPHSTHNLQPLDVGLFSPLQHYYGAEVDDACRTGVTGIQKDRFISLYERARDLTFTPETIQSAWAATGLVPFDPSRVLSKFEEILEQQRPSTPAIIPPSSYVPQTPQNSHEAELLYNSIVSEYLQSPTIQAYSREIANLLQKMKKAIVQGFTNSELYKNQAEQSYKSRKDKTKNKKMISKGRVLDGDTAQDLKERQERDTQIARLKAKRTEIENGCILPENEVANPDYFVPDLGAHALEPDEPDFYNNCWVLRTYAYPAVDLKLPGYAGQQKTWKDWEILLNKPKPLYASQSTFTIIQS